MNNIYCEACKKEFTPQVQEQKINSTTFEQFFDCPHCSKKYTVFLSDFQTKKIFDKIAQLRARTNRLARMGRDKEIPVIIDEIDRLQRQAKEHNRNLQQK